MSAPDYDTDDRGGELGYADLDGRTATVTAELAFAYTREAEVLLAPLYEAILQRASEIELATATTRALKLERAGQRQQAQAVMQQSLAANMPFMAAPAAAEAAAAEAAAVAVAAATTDPRVSAAAGAAPGPGLQGLDHVLLNRLGELATERADLAVGVEVEAVLRQVDVGFVRDDPQGKMRVEPGTTLLDVGRGRKRGCRAAVAS